MRSRPNRPLPSDPRSALPDPATGRPAGLSRMAIISQDRQPVRRQYDDGAVTV
ncbi:hypothetical protein [Tsuneonella flava]|uniref:hypothetical protein n=1 Tax=Tsuneonella flava TaxID=2055955 RepID=UPI0018E407A0|nr:hypothetical protein [Tsuneonella flava]